MALRGSLDDFNIMNILQMIKLEGKTGKLTLAEGEDLVKITFDNGSVIYAESAPQRDEARLKSTMVSNKILSAAAWESIKKEHEDGLKPYWEILAKKISSKLIVELIRRQILDNVYYALRWKKGTYEFTPMKSIKYNEKVMAPLDVDALLMEGCRIADEWPRVTAALPSMDTYLVKNIIGEEEEDDSLSVRAQESAATADFRSSLEYEILNARGVQLKDSEVAVLSVAGEGKTIHEILDSARQAHFESLEAVQRLLHLGILKQAKKKKKKALAADHSGIIYRIAVAAVLLGIVGGGIYWQITSWPNIFEAQKSGLTEVKQIQALGGLKKIEHGLKIYVSLHGRMPQSLDNLVDAGILNQSDLMDPWNNHYRFNAKADRFTLYSSGPDAFLSKENVYLPST